MRRCHQLPPVTWAGRASAPIVPSALTALMSVSRFTSMFVGTNYTSYGSRSLSTKPRRSAFIRISRTQKSLSCSGPTGRRSCPSFRTSSA
ncbi:hypothetical protein NX02_p1035 (plasmid) [Sphingomonas sanxanigenens DSM 19645 = NX02]|uniref:Uncharacterized protein n=1 Tax=Sphingomonas sanxanigenens DSM 19645 = NX02 TaxID=1123269 RepID=A0A0F7JW18_9SPHN|nr:hypothetical protein NX02_p1035 [Sphingomonas sanxanigenens DSM 19645 = NX02]